MENGGIFLAYQLNYFYKERLPLIYYSVRFMSERQDKCLVPFLHSQVFKLMCCFHITL